MKRIGLFYIFLLLLLVGCSRTVQLNNPPIQPLVSSKVKQVKNSLKYQKKNTKELPSVLGGIVQSDTWTVYREKQQEEFSGHVFYDNGTYTFKSDYALSERTHHLLTAKGNVYLRQKDSDGSSYEAYAHTARFNYKTQQGTLTAKNKKNPVRLIYTDPLRPSITANAQKVTFDLDSQVYTLEGNVNVNRVTPEGTQTFRAEKALFRQAEDYVRLEGNAILSDGLRFLEAETIVYDGTKNQSYAYGARPLLHGTAEQGTFAIIADKVSSDAEGNRIAMDGKVQGWIVSPQINQIDFSKFNKGFNYGTAQ